MKRPTPTSSSLVSDRLMTSHPSYASHIGRKEEDLDTAFWERRYIGGDTGWDLGGPSPGLLDFLEKQSYTPGRVLVPGCGRGHDARALAKAGFEVVGIDIAPSAVREAETLAQSESLPIRFACADYFSLPAGRYDWIFEHTFFCAIDPALRDRYVEVATGLLNPDGRLLGIFFNIQGQVGPPFGTTREELRARFGPRFLLELQGVPPSRPDREGKELLMLWKRREGD